MATKRFDFKFHCIKDADIIRRLDAQENKQQYIRQLIATDIMADSLRDAFKIGDSHAVHQDPNPDPEELMEQKRIDFYNDNCPAVNEPDSNVDPCSGCKFKVNTDNYSDCYTCTIESAWNEYKNSIYISRAGGLYKREVTDNGKK